jgi:hypothetical protein
MAVLRGTPLIKEVVVVVVVVIVIVVVIEIVIKIEVIVISIEIAIEALVIAILDSIVIIRRKTTRSVEIALMIEEAMAIDIDPVVAITANGSNT